MKINKLDDTEIPPDPEKDFIGFTRWQINQINRLHKELEAEKQREADENHKTENENTLWQEWNKY